MKKLGDGGRPTTVYKRAL